MQSQSVKLKLKVYREKTKRNRSSRKKSKKQKELLNQFCFDFMLLCEFWSLDFFFSRKKKQR